MLLHSVKGPDKQYVIDIVLITALCIPIYFVVLATVPMTSLLGDAAWYLNRAHVYQQGIFRGAYVYTLLFPLLVAGIDFLFHDLVSAGLMVNWLALYSIILGTYLLGRSLYHRRIAWLSVLVIITSSSLLYISRQLEADLLFVAVIVWCILIYRHLTCHPSKVAAILFGLALAAAVYTRIEGAAYALLLPLAMWQVYQSTHNWRKALLLGLISGLVFIIAVGPFVIVMLRNSSSSGDAFALFRVFSEVPVPWDIVSRRITDSLTTALVLWPVWAWWLVVIGVIWGLRDSQKANFTLAMLIVFNIAYVFILSIWPTVRITIQALPYFALLFSASAYFLSTQIRYRRIVAPLLVTALCVPGLQTMMTYANVQPFAYQVSQLAQDGRAVDAWLAERGWQYTEVYTLCPDLLPFARSHFYGIYRLVLNADTGSMWDSPSQLLPYMRDHNQLLMSCGEPVYYPDWKAFFESQSKIGQASSPTANNPGSDRLVEVGRISRYVFYQVAHVQ